MTKTTKFQGYLEYQANLLSEKLREVYESIYHLKENFISFLFHINVPNTFEVIALLLKTNIIFGNFLVNFCLV